MKHVRVKHVQQAPAAPSAADWVGWCCPYCAAALQLRDHGLWCDAEHRFFATTDGVHRLLSEERRREVLPIVELERRVRAEAGSAPTGLKDATLRRSLELAASALGTDPWRVLQVGARSTWLATRLRERGHSVAVVGLDAAALSESPLRELPRAEADMEALPVEPAHVDLVVADGSLHDSPRLARTLVELRRVTRRGGLLLITGSPVYRTRPDAESAQERHMKQQVARWKVAIPREQQPHFLVLPELRDAFRSAGWSLDVHGWPGWLAERVGAALGRLRPGGAHARTPILLARREG